MQPLTEREKHELVASLFEVLDTDLVDGETVFMELDPDETISVNGHYVKSIIL